MPGPSSGNPITPQSVTVLNATYDRYFSNFRKRKANLIHVGGSNEDADYDIFPREACALHILPTAQPPLGARTVVYSCSQRCHRRWRSC